MRNVLINRVSVLIVSILDRRYASDRNKTALLSVSPEPGAIDAYQEFSLGGRYQYGKGHKPLLMVDNAYVPGLYSSFKTLTNIREKQAPFL